MESERSFEAFPVPLPVGLTPGLRGEVGGKERWTPIYSLFSHHHDIEANIGEILHIPAAS